MHGFKVMQVKGVWKKGNTLSSINQDSEKLVLLITEILSINIRFSSLYFYTYWPYEHAQYYMQYE